MSTEDLEQEVITFLSQRGEKSFVSLNDSYDVSDLLIGSPALYVFDWQARESFQKDCCQGVVAYIPEVSSVYHLETIASQSIPRVAIRPPSGTHIDHYVLDDESFNFDRTSVFRSEQDDYFCKLPYLFTAHSFS